MAVTLDNRQRPEPEVLIVNAAADGEVDQMTYQADDVVLAVEVVPSDSDAVIGSAGLSSARTPQSGTSGGWRTSLTGIHHDRLVLTVPFDIDLTEIDKL